MIKTLRHDTTTVRAIESACRLTRATLKAGGKILIVGNGGSAAEAQHFAAELVGRFKIERVALPALALTTDTSALTAIANDYGFDEVFERQILGLGQKKDLLFILSTSGNSKNVLKAAEAAKKREMKVVGLLGKDGGAAKDMADIAIVISSNDTARIQELQLAIIHTICEYVDIGYAHTR